jgi:hypothetical protein
MANPGDTKERFGRSYIYLIPSGNAMDVGTWRVRVDDEGTPPVDGGGGGGDVDLSFRAVLALDETDADVGTLVYLDSNGQARKASASSVDTADVAGMVVVAASPGELVTFTRNEIRSIYNIPALVDGGNSFLTPGDSYYLSTTPGNWTTTPDTTTPGAVVRPCGLAMDESQMLIEIQSATVI